MHLLNGEKKRAHLAELGIKLDHVAMGLKAAMEALLEAMPAERTP